MSEDAQKTMSPSFLLEAIIGADELAKYKEMASAGKFSDENAHKSYVRKLAVRFYGKIIPDADLKKHDEKIKSEIERLFEKYLSQGRELKKAQESAKSAQSTRNKWHSYAKSMEDRFYKMLGKAVGYDVIFAAQCTKNESARKPESAEEKEPGNESKPHDPFVKDKHGKRLKDAYVKGLVEYIITNFVKADVAGKKVSALEQKVSVLEQDKNSLQRELDELKEKYAASEQELSVYKTGIKDIVDKCETKEVGEK